MATNHYFPNFNSFTEQQILEELTIEAIKMKGIDVLYVPRSIVIEDDIMNEIRISKFTQGFEIEMYLESVDGFDGDGDMLSKFGIQIKDSASFVVSKSRFVQESGMDRPMEGDLIFFPLSQTLFVIRFVEHENPFYQLGKNFTYKLSVEAFDYNNEEFDTGEPLLDELTIDYSRVLRLALDSGLEEFATGSTVFVGNSLEEATATAEVVSHDIEGDLLTIRTISGEWEESGTVQDGSISWTYTGVEDITDDPDFRDNDNFDEEAKNILDWNEKDPFSEGFI